MPALEFTIELAKQSLHKEKAVYDLLILPCFSRTLAPITKSKIQAKLEIAANEFLTFFETRMDNSLRDIISDEASGESFDASIGKSLYLRHVDKSSPRILFCGLGIARKANLHRIEQSLAKIFKEQLSLKKIKSLGVLLPPQAPFNPSALALPVIAALFQYCYVSQESRDTGPQIQKATFYSEVGGSKQLKLTELNKHKTLAYARALAMDLVNMPPNLKKTITLAQTAQSLKRHKAIKVGTKEDIGWIEKQMPCFYTVARGSLKSDPPRWIHATYTPPKKAKKTFVLVGKSVIFDTGGYQLKPDQYMNTMKADMTGGATVLAVLQALTQLKPQNIAVHAMLAATPNMVDSDAFVPDSIIDTTCGKKVEVRHTDAEGRLTLIDAVTMAQKIKPDLIITIATLTGAAAHAVGPRTALMSNHAKWEERYAQAAQKAGDPLQKLSIEEEDFEGIQSKLDSADICNDSHNKYRGAQSAAAFILSGLNHPEMNGIESEQALLHLDIAGGDMTSDGKATGIAVKGLLNFLLEEDSSC